MEHSALVVSPNQKQIRNHPASYPSFTRLLACLLWETNGKRNGTTLEREKNTQPVVVCFVQCLVWMVVPVTGAKEKQLLCTKNDNPHSPACGLVSFHSEPCAWRSSLSFLGFLLFGFVLVSGSRLETESLESITRREEEEEEANRTVEILFHKDWYSKAKERERDESEWNQQRETTTPPKHPREPRVAPHFLGVARDDKKLFCVVGRSVCLPAQVRSRVCFVGIRLLPFFSGHNNLFLKMFYILMRSIDARECTKACARARTVSETDGSVPSGTHQPHATQTQEDQRRRRWNS